MARKILTERDLQVAIVRARIVPVVTTILGSCIALLPVVTVSSAMPPFGLLMLLGWRLLRNEIWPAWIGLPLGLVDDLITGQPIGSAMFLWTATLLLLDFVDAHLIWRDYWIDTLVASAAIILCIGLGYFFAGIGATPVPLGNAMPQMIMSMLCFPITTRIIAALDRWRLPS